MIDWGMGRDEELKYAEKHGIEVMTQYKKYSVDENIWGRSCECDIIETPEEIPPEDSIEWLQRPDTWPNEPEIVKVGFTKGVPSSFNDKEMTSSSSLYSSFS